MTAFEQTQPGFVSAFRTAVDRNEIASRLRAQPGFQSTLQDRPNETFQWSGTAADKSLVEIWSEREEGLFGLKISPETADLLARANAYFEFRTTIHQVLEAKLVVTSVLQEILSAFHARRDMLELDGQDLRELPPQIGMLTELEVLSLSNNRLTCLPPEIGLLSKLVELAVDENCLTELTPHIGLLTNLQILLLTQNRLRNLPASIGNLANLRTLKLDQNQLRGLPPEIGKLSKLRRFSIPDNRLTELPAEFAQLDGLQDFDWKKWESNPRKGLPPRNVRNFIAHGNPWVHPPAEIMKRQVDVIREYLKANPIDPNAAAPYTVYVDDNFHHMDESYRYKLGAFSDCQSATAACQKIVDEFFLTHSKDTHNNATAQELFDSYRRFGEDPFIQTSDRSCLFSAWKYAEQLCQELATGAVVIGESGLYRPTPPVPPVQPQQPAQRFVSSLVLADADVTSLLSKLRPAFPELEWEGSDDSRGRIHLEGETKEKPSKMGVHLLRKEPTGPFTLTVRLEPIDMAPGAADALKTRVEKALLAVVPPSPEIQSGAIPRRTPPSSPLPPPLPRIISLQPTPSATITADGFRFDSIIDIPAAVEPAMESKLRKEFPELKWVDHAENWDKVRIEGISQNAPRYLVVSIARKESPGPFKLRITVGARDQSEADKFHNEVIRRLAWASIGWSEFPLPLFKPRPAASVDTDSEDIDREEIVDLQLPLEGPRIVIFLAHADILISRTLIESLSLHHEVLDSWMKTLPGEGSGGGDPENRDALMRGAAARVILRQSASTGAGLDLQTPLGLVRPAHSLIGELLALGLAQVLQYGAAGRTPGASISPRRIKVHYLKILTAPTGGSGYISYSAAKGEAQNLGEFLRLDWGSA